MKFFFSTSLLKKLQDSLLQKRKMAGTLQMQATVHQNFDNVKNPSELFNAVKSKNASAFLPGPGFPSGTPLSDKSFEPVLLHFADRTDIRWLITGTEVPADLAAPHGKGKDRR